MWKSPFEVRGNKMILASTCERGWLGSAVRHLREYRGMQLRNGIDSRILKLSPDAHLTTLQRSKTISLRRKNASKKSKQAVRE